MYEFKFSLIFIVNVYILVEWSVCDVYMILLFDFLLVKIIIILSVFVWFDVIKGKVFCRGILVFVFILFWYDDLMIEDFIWFLLKNWLKVNFVEIVELNVIILIFMLLGLIVR